MALVLASAAACQSLAYPGSPLSYATDIGDLVSLSELICTGQILETAMEVKRPARTIWRDVTNRYVFKIERVLKDTRGAVRAGERIAIETAGYPQDDVETNQWYVAFLKANGEKFGPGSRSQPALIRISASAASNRHPARTTEEIVELELIDSLSDPDPATSMLAFETLYYVRPRSTAVRKKMIATSKRLARSRNITIRLKSIMLLLRVDPGFGFKLGESILMERPKGDPNILNDFWWLARAISEIRDPRFAPMLWRLRSHAQSEDIQRAATYALRQMDGLVGIPRLIRALRSAEPEQRFQAAVALTHGSDLRAG